MAYKRSDTRPDQLWIATSGGRPWKVDDESSWQGLLAAAVRYGGGITGGKVMEHETTTD
jgi:hypothetical protein